MTRSNPFAYFTLRGLGITLCVLPVTAAILCYFPVWVAEGGEGIVPGITLLLLVLAALPLWRLIRRALASLASYTLWLIAFVVFLCLSRIADEMTVISFVGFVGNALGAIMFKLSDRLRDN